MPSAASAVRAVAGALLAALAVVVAVLAGAAPAGAHAALTGSDPAEGSVVDAAPRQVTLTFSEGVTMADGSLRVLDPSGARVDTGTVREVTAGGGDAAARRGVSLKSGLRDGTYTVAWQAVSADSHPVSGAFTFSVGAPSRTSAHAGAAASGAGGGVVGALYGVGRYVAYAGFTLLVGGACFVLFCWPGGARVRAVQRVVVGGWVALTAATLVMLLLRSPYTGSGRLADAVDLGGLRAVLDTKPGAVLLARLLLLGVSALFVAVLFGTYARAEAAGAAQAGGAAASAPDTEEIAEAEEAEEGEETDRQAGARGRPEERRDLVFGLVLGGGVLAAGLAGTWAVAEHASTGIQTGLAMPLDVVHLLAVAVWLGGLVTMLAVLYAGPPLDRHAAARFSRLAFGSVLVLAATGLYQAWRQVGTPDALVSTSYGRLLLIKVALVAVLVGCGGISRRWTRRLAEAGAAAPSASTAVERREPAAEPVAVAAGPTTPGTETGSETALGTGTGTAGGNVASPTGGESSGAGTTAGGTTTAGDAARAAQLARQRAAVETAKRRKARDADTERSGLRRSVLAEAGVAVVLLAVTTFLTNTEPARTAEAAQTATGPHGSAPATAGGEGDPHAGHTGAAHHHGGTVRRKVPFDTGGPHGKGTAQLAVAPGSTGANTALVSVTDSAGKPLDVPEVRLALTLEAQHIGPITVPLKQVGGKVGEWRADSVQIPMAGDWQAAVTVRTSDIDEATERTGVPVG